MPRTGGPPSPLPLPLPLPPGTATHRKYSIGGRTTRNCICLLVLPTYLPTSAIMYTVWPVLYLHDPSPPAPRSTSAGASTHRTRGAGAPTVPRTGGPPSPLPLPQYKAQREHARDTAALNARATILEEEACAPPAGCMAKG